VARIADLLAGGRTTSFEFFPPKTDAAWLTLGHTIAELEPLRPSFVSVTYGAGGSTRAKTHQLVSWIRSQTPITPMAHLTCVSHTRAEIAGILESYREAGVENILALGGDPSKDAAAGASDFSYASDLLEFVRGAGAFSVGVAAHPEVHPRSPDRATDRKHLAGKLAVADFAVTQFFFEAEHYFRLVDELDALGCRKPVVPGIIPVTHRAQAHRMAELSGAAFPGWLEERLEAAGEDPAAVRRVGVDAATELCAELLEGGVPGLHFYTMNQSQATLEICRRMGAA
jgi:methylenetetrahydrofolate reductase (NADPH)